MKVSHKDQLSLLELQETDLAISQLRHALATDPLLEKRDEVRARAEDLRRSIIGQKADLIDRQRRIKQVEAEVDQVATRGKVQQDRLDSGKVGIRDMSAVEHEIKTINERHEQLELEVLKLEEDLEARQKFLADTEAAAAALLEDERRTDEEIAQAAAEPTEKLGTALALSEQLRESLPADVLEEYDHLRSRQGALVVLRFENGALVNAPIELTAEEVSSLRRAPEDELWVSPEWGFIVVRA